MASPAKADLDFDLKLKTAAALSASGYSCRLNVALSAVGDTGLADVTDVDVLAISRDLTFTPRVMCVSAKAGTNLVVAKELFYLRGVLSYMRGDDGVLLLGGRDVPPHLRELAASLSLLLLVQGEIDTWRSALVNGVHDPGYFAEPLFLEYEKAMNALPPSSSIRAFLAADYWFYRDFRNVQNLIGHLKKFAPTLDGKSKLHATQFLDVAWHFAQTILDVCLHVQRGGTGRLAESVNMYMFGGRTNYKARKDLLVQVTQVLVKTGVARADAMPSLDPGYAPALAELVVRFLERPHAAIMVPLVLQDALWRGLGAIGMEPTPNKNKLSAFKLAQDLVDFLKAASDVPWTPSL
jgi:hypothetical protein